MAPAKEAVAPSFGIDKRSGGSAARPWGSLGPTAILGMGAITAFGTGVDCLFDGLCRCQPKFVRYQPFVDAAMKYPFAAPIAEEALLKKVLPEANAANIQAPATDDSPDDPNHKLVWNRRETRLLWAAVEQAVEQAFQRETGDWHSELAARSRRVGLFVGTSAAGVGALGEALRGATKHGQRQQARYYASCEAVARRLGVQGPVQVICTACASGAQAIAQGCQWIAMGAVDVAIAGGFDALEPFVGAGFDALGATAARPLPFRLQRCGLVLGEAAGAVVLARAKTLPGDAIGHVTGWGFGSDAFHLTSPHPDARGLVHAMSAAMGGAIGGTTGGVMRQGGVSTGNIVAINAHGTATVYNDRMEARAVEILFGSAGKRAPEVPVYTVKGTIGHTLGAAGAVEAIVAVTSMNRRVLPPTCTEGPHDPACNVNLVTAPTECRVGTTLSLSAGFGGVNCVLALTGGQPQ